MSRRKEMDNALRSYRRRRDRPQLWSAIAGQWDVLWHLTTSKNVVIITNMAGELLLSERRVVSEEAFVEIVVWRLPESVSGSLHGFKYRLALVVNGLCVLRYDNEKGKGDHKHVGEKTFPYAFTTPQALIADFWNEVDSWSP